MMLRALKLLLMAGAGFTAVAAPVLSATCDEEVAQVRQGLTEARLSSAERREYQALLQAARAMQQNGDEQVCLDILQRTQRLLARRASAEPGAADGPARAARYAGLKDAPPLSQIAPFESIRGLDVVNAKGESLGNIVDLVVGDHEIQYALLSMSSAFSGDDKVYPVPIDVLRIGDDPDRAGAGAPADAAAASIAAAGQPLTTVVTATPPGAAMAPPADAGPQDPTGDLGPIAAMTAGDLVGNAVRNNRDESVGKVDAVVLWPGAVQVEAVLSVGGFLGLGDQQVSVPLSRLTPGEHGLRFKTPVTEDELKTLPEVEVHDQDRLPDETVIAAVMPPGAPAPGAPAQTSAADAGPAAGQPAPRHRDPAAQSPATATVDRGARAATDAGDEPQNPLAGKVLVLDIDRVTLEQAPGFSAAAYPDLADAAWHRTVLAFYEDLLHVKPAKTRPD